jgi:hypothetical protein
MKIAIFVEGYTELAFVREFLLRHYEYQNIDILCQELRGGQYSGVNYDFPNSSDFYDDANNKDKFLLIDCGGDQITSKILQREKFLIQNSFTKIIGLRDVYSLEFRKEVSNSFDRVLVESFTKFNQDVIRDNSTSNLVFLCFAIMEIESWYLGMPNVFLKRSVILDDVTIYGLFQENDPEEIFKPSTVIERIYNLVKEEYKKKERQSDSLSNYPIKDDYNTLYQVNNCNSFNLFCDTIGLDMS